MARPQIALLGARASYRVFEKDLAAGVPLADKAIALAGHDPAFVFDVAAAYAAKAKAAYLQQDPTEIVANSVRAYLRGVEDPWISDIIKQLPADTQAALQAQRTALRNGAGAYAFAISPQAQTSDKIETAKRAVAEGNCGLEGIRGFRAKTSSGYVSFLAPHMMGVGNRHGQGIGGIRSGQSEAR